MKTKEMSLSERFIASANRGLHIWIDVLALEILIMGVIIGVMAVAGLISLAFK